VSDDTKQRKEQMIERILLLPMERLEEIETALSIVAKRCGGDAWLRAHAGQQKKCESRGHRHQGEGCMSTLNRDPRKYCALIIYDPQPCGKSYHASALAKFFRKGRVVHELPYGNFLPRCGTLYLLHTPLDNPPRTVVQIPFTKACQMAGITPKNHGAVGMSLSGPVVDKSETTKRGRK